uniref:Uncharacterized protein n=1 Tax=Lactuca sativa TaxID=4236 RepID=A0A9R1VIN9_LACSA|nr:hypothetical protein LSAT_V11C500267870 [Lactuca sativa]
MRPSTSNQSREQQHKNICRVHDPGQPNKPSSRSLRIELNAIHNKIEILKAKSIDEQPPNLMINTTMYQDTKVRYTSVKNVKSKLQYQKKACNPHDKHHKFIAFSSMRY